MAIAVDANSLATVANSSSLTWSHTVGSGANRVLIVGAGGALSSNVSSITYNGVNLTQAMTYNTWKHNELWYLTNPASGTNTIVVNFSTTDWHVAGAISLTGASQGTIVDGSGSDSNQSNNGITATVVTSFPGSFVLGCGIDDNGNKSITGGTLQWNGSASSPYSTVGISQTTTTPGSYSVSFINQNGLSTKSIIAIGVLVASSGTGGTMSLMGVG